jgi:hypothetical protein
VVEGQGLERLSLTRGAPRGRVPHQYLRERGAERRDEQVGFS